MTDSASASDVPRHPVVAIAGGLGQGFRSGAVSSEFSFVDLVAEALGHARPRAPRFDGNYGIPLNLEQLARSIEERFGKNPAAFDTPRILLHARRFLKDTEWYWYHGPGSLDSRATAEIPENLSITDLDMVDILNATADTIRARMPPPPRLSWVPHVVGSDRIALHVLAPARSGDTALTVIEAAQRLGENGTSTDPSENGIGILLVHVGFDMALDPVTTLALAWSDTQAEYWNRYNGLLPPTQFEQIVAELARQFAMVRADRLIWGTIPRPSTLPLVRGIGAVVIDGYHQFYARPWARGRRFNPRTTAHLSGEDMRIVDQTVDAYNAAITAAVDRARADGRDWRIADVAGLYRRIAGLAGSDPDRRAFLPPALARLDPEFSGKFFLSDDVGRIEGGFFSLDGLYPTGIGQGLIAQEYLDVLADGGPRAAARIDFDALLRRDSLLHRPPALTRTYLSALAILQPTPESRTFRGLAAVGRLARRGLALAARFLFPAAMAAAVIVLAVGRDRTLDTVLAVVAGIALWVRLVTISVPSRRNRFFDRLTDRRGPAAPTAYAVNTLAVALLFATTLTHLLNQPGLAPLN